MKNEALEIIEKRQELVQKYASIYGLSLFDLCRIFEVSPIGMHTLVQKYNIQVGHDNNHPDIVTGIISNTYSCIMDKTSENKSESEILQILKEFGLYRFPIRWKMGEMLEDKYGEAILEEYKEIRGINWRKRMEKQNKTLSLDEFRPYENAIYELYSIGFKFQEIKEYVSGFIAPSMITTLLNVYSGMDPKNVIKRNTRKQDSSGNIIKTDYNLPVQIAGDEDFIRFLNDGVNIEQMVMLTGDKEVTIIAARERLGIKKSYEIKRPKMAKEMFQAYLDHTDMTMEEIARTYFDSTRGTFYHKIKDYIKTATEEEKAAFAARKVIAGNLRTEAISRTKRARLS